MVGTLRCVLVCKAALPAVRVLPCDRGRCSLGPAPLGHEASKQRGAVENRGLPVGAQRPHPRDDGKKEFLGWNPSAL